MYGEQLTGEIRYRIETNGFFNHHEILVLQVQIKWPDGPNDWQGNPENLAGAGWRDAKPEDVPHLKPEYRCQLVPC